MAAPAAIVSDPTVLAAASLRQSAISLLSSPSSTPGWARRILALTRFSARMTPADPRVNAMQADLFLAMNDANSAAQSLKKCLDADGNNHVVGVKWLRLRLDHLNSAESRIAFLDDFLSVSGVGFPPALRAEAAAQLGLIYAGQGEQDKAQEAFANAQKLDPYNGGALSGLLSLQKDPPPAEKAKWLMESLRGDPRDVEIAWHLGATLDDLGLYEQALLFFDHAWALNKQMSQDPPYLFISQYFNAMLDAGQSRKPIDLFEPLLDQYGQSMDLRSLLMEAYRRLNDDQKVRKMIDEMEKAYKAKEADANASSATATQLAWFYVLTLPKPTLALKYARIAAAFDEPSPVIQRVLGVAELMTDQQADGERILKGLVKKDAYAAAFLAKYYYDTGNTAAAEETLQAGAALGRSGPAYRRIADMVAKYKLRLPPAGDAPAVLDLMGKFDRRYLLLAISPEKYLSVELQCPSKQIVPGELADVSVVLTNKGDIDVPLGDDGLISPVISLRLEVAAVSGLSINPPLATWPAPRYLCPGQSIQCSFPLQVGAVGDYLARRPFDNINVSVAGTVDPVTRGERYGSAVMALTPETLKILRWDLLGQYDHDKPEECKKAYDQAIGAILYQLHHGQLADRMAAARQTASVLASLREAELGLQDLPKILVAVASKPVALRLMVEATKDPSDVVRAELLAALQVVHMDDKMLSYLAPVIDDPSPLVRMRLVELLGASGLSGQENVLEYLAQDSDELVRLMAGAFVKKK